MELRRLVDRPQNHSGAGDRISYELRSAKVMVAMYEEKKDFNELASGPISSDLEEMV